VKTVYQKPWAYTVLEDWRGRLFMNVLCGGIAMYDVRIELTAEEIEIFRGDPSGLDALATKIAYSPESFAHRRA
jgi:hypothetical protein